MRISRTPIIPTLCLACTVVVCSFALFFLVGQGVFQMASLLAEKNRELEDLKTQEQHIREFRETRSSFSATLQSLDNLFIDANNPIAFLEFLEAAASRQGLSIDVIPNSPLRLPQDLWASMTFTVHSKGPYQSAVRFLETLDNAPYLLEMREVHIAVHKENPGSNVDFSFVVKLYTK